MLDKILEYIDTREKELDKEFKKETDRYDSHYILGKKEELIKTKDMIKELKGDK
mgnify:CR=1 FL=1